MTAYEQESLLPHPPPPPTPQVTTPPPPPPPPRKTLADTDYKSVARLGRVLQLMMLGWAVLAGLAAGATVRLRGAYSDLETNPLALTPEELADLEDAHNVYEIVQLAVFFVIAVVFLVWFRRMHVNLRALGEPRTRHSDGWAVGSWFVPFLNFVRPKQIADDIWRRSDPERSRGAITPGAPHGPVPSLIHWWWGLYLGSGFLVVIGDAVGSTDSVSGATRLVTWWLVDDVLQVALGVIAFLVVAAFTDRQGRRAAFIVAQEAPAEPPPPEPLTFDAVADAPVAPPMQEDASTTTAVVDPPPEAPAQVRLAWVGGTLVLALLAMLLSASLIDDPEPSQSVAGTPTVVFELEPGDCFNFPDSIDQTDFTNVQAILAVDVVSCDEPHAGEMVTDVVWSGSGSTFPGDDVLVADATELCFPEIEEYVGANFLVAGVDVFVVVPDRVRWNTGDRGIECMAPALDADQSLEWSLRGAGSALPDDRRTWWSLQLGDCFDEPTGTLGLSVGLASCDGPHDYETFAVVTHPAAVGAPFPGDNEMLDWAELECAAAYGEVIDPDKSANIDYSFGGTPLEQTWRDGHRTVTCVLWNQVAPLTESVLLD